MDLSNTITETLQNINISKTDEKIKDTNEKIKNRECIELKNLEYKNVMMYGNNLKPKDESSNVAFIEDLLEKESQLNKLDLWTKLDKTEKIFKLKAYAKTLVDLHKLNTDEEKKLNLYLVYCLERKYISKIKDVNYNKETGNIESIPNLIFNEDSRTFNIKKSDKHGNTLKSLAPKKNKTQKY